MVMAASAVIAPIQPSSEIRRWISGANTNWPKEPPALMMPAAMPRRSSGMRLDAAPISTENPAAPEPAEVSTPTVKINPHEPAMTGVSAKPTAITAIPNANTRPGP